MNRWIVCAAVCFSLVAGVEFAQARGRGTCSNCQVYYPTAPLVVASNPVVAPVETEVPVPPAPDQPSAQPTETTTAPAVSTFARASYERGALRPRLLRRWRR